MVVDLAQYWAVMMGNRLGLKWVDLSVDYLAVELAEWRGLLSGLWMAAWMVVLKAVEMAELMVVV